MRRDARDLAIADPETAMNWLGSRYSHFELLI